MTMYRQDPESALAQLIVVEGRFMRNAIFCGT